MLQLRSATFSVAMRLTRWGTSLLADHVEALWALVVSRN